MEDPSETDPPSGFNHNPSEKDFPSGSHHNPPETDFPSDLKTPELRADEVITYTRGPHRLSVGRTGSEILIQCSAWVQPNGILLTDEPVIFNGAVARQLANMILYLAE